MGNKIMDLFKGKKALTLPITTTRRTLDFLTTQVNRNIAVYPSYNISDYANRYCTQVDVYSVIRMLATTAALVPINPYLIKNDTAAKQLKKLVRPHANPLMTKAIMIKALEELPETDPLFELLENPSTLMGKFEFYEALYTFLKFAGEAFILKEKPEFGVNAGKPVSLMFMHPENVVLKVSDTLPRKVVAYDYRLEGGVKIFENIPAEDVIHIKYFNPELNFSGAELRGLSPLRVLAKTLVQMDSNQDVQTAQMQNGGVEVIVYDKAPMDEAAVEIAGKRKDNFYRFLKDKTNAGAPFFATGEMGSVQLGSTIADLKVIESANISFKKLCNAFGTSDILFNNGDASTESNVKEMVRRTYTNTVLPDVYRVRDAFIKSLLPDFADGKKRDIREDISEIPELQPNSKEMAEWLAIAWWVSPNDKLEMMKFERSPNPLMNEPLIPQGLQTLDDLLMVEPLPDVTGGK